MDIALLLPLFATVCCLAASERQRRFAHSKRRRRRNDALLFGTASVVVGVVAFEPNIGLVHEPIVPEPAGFIVQAALLWTGLICAVLAWVYHQ